MMANMKRSETVQSKPMRYDLPGYPKRVLPLYWVAYKVRNSTANPRERPAR